MSERRIIVRGGHLVTMDPALGIIPQGDGLVEDGEITAVATSLPAVDAEVIDARGHIVAPAAGVCAWIQPDGDWWINTAYSHVGVAHNNRSLAIKFVTITVYRRGRRCRRSRLQFARPTPAAPTTWWRNPLVSKGISRSMSR